MSVSETHYSGGFRNATSTERPSGERCWSKARWVVCRRDSQHFAGRTGPADGLLHADWLLLATEREGQQARGDINNGNHTVVRHPRGSDHAQRAHDLPVHFIGRRNNAHFLDRYEIRLAADKNLHALRVARDIE